MSETTPLLAEEGAEAGTAGLTCGSCVGGSAIYAGYCAVFLAALGLCIGVPIATGLFSQQGRDRYSLPFCHPEFQYQLSPPSGLWTARVCSNLTICTDAEYQTVPPTKVSDRECALLTVCTPEEWESTLATPLSDRECSPLTVCSQSQYISKEHTRTSDRECADITMCTTKQYETQAPTKYSDRVCAPLTQCHEGQYEAQAPRPTVDRKCSNYTNCTSSQYELTAPTPTSDRVCAGLRNCTETEYESKAPTATSDRQCTQCTVCTDKQYEIEAPTKTGDRKCKPLTPCTHEEYQSVPPTKTTDRVCNKLTICKPSEYEIEQSTPTSNRRCGLSFLEKITETAPEGTIDAKKQGGLTGDGKTDDTVALEKLIAKAKEDGKAVFLPAGQYLISRDIGINAFTSIIGSSKGMTILKRNTRKKRSLTFGQPGLLSGDEVKDVVIENIFLDGVSISFGGFGKSNLTIDRCAFYSSSELKEEKDFWSGLFGGESSAYIEWSGVADSRIEYNVFLRPKFAVGMAVRTMVTSNVTISRNIFGADLSPDGLDFLTMEKHRKVVGGWSALVEKLRFLRNENRLPFNNAHFDPRSLDNWLDSGLVIKDNINIKV